MEADAEHLTYPEEASYAAMDNAGGRAWIRDGVRNGGYAQTPSGGGDKMEKDKMMDKGKMMDKKDDKMMDKGKTMDKKDDKMMDKGKTMEKKDDKMMEKKQ